MEKHSPLKLAPESDYRWLALIKRHGSKVLTALLIIAAVLVWRERRQDKGHYNEQQDFVQASQIFERFQRGEQIELESLLTAEGIVKRHPQLLGSYENMLARSFFAQHDASKGILYARNILKRNQASLPEPYLRYGQATLLIAESKLDEALEVSRELRAEKGSLLEAFNLIRLAMLGEEECWVTLQRHPRFEMISPLFHEGAASLEQLHPAPTIPDQIL